MNLTGLSTLDLSILKPAMITVDTKGGGMEGGRSGDGESITINTTGGGRLMVSYGDCFIHEPADHEYVNQIAARLNGSFRAINVPIMSDWMGPFPLDSAGIPDPFFTPLFDTDESLIDGATEKQGSVFGVVAAAASLNAGSIIIDIAGSSRSIVHSAWFSIEHSTKGHRAYRAWTYVDSGTVPMAYNGKTYAGHRYQLWLDRPLRQAVTVGQFVTFSRPLCVMKFPADFSLEWNARGFWISRPTIDFVEAF